ncbi:MAG: hypothetical protein GX335_07895 [Firmicutes bacterium]|nr:hypothetical protein [Bacillota bacterium]
MAHFSIPVLGLLTIFTVIDEIASFIKNQYDPAVFRGKQSKKWRWLGFVAVLAGGLIEPRGLRTSVYLVILTIITVNKAVLDALTYRKTGERIVITQLFQSLAISLVLFLLLIVWSKS